MKSIGEQAQEFRLWKGWNYVEMARAVQEHYPEGVVSRQKITELEKVGTRLPRYVAALAQTMGTTVEALVAGEWSKPEGDADAFGDEIRFSVPGVEEPKFLRIDLDEPSNAEKTRDIRRPVRVAVVGHVKGGDDGYLEEMQFPMGSGEGYVEYWTKDSRAYALRIKGDSMHPRYRAGEFVVVTPGVEAQPGQDVVVKLVNGRKLLKQLNWIRGDELQLLSINNGYAPITLSLSEIESVHRVAGSVSSDAFIEP